MSQAIVWTASATRDMRRLDPQVARRIVEAVERLARTGHGDVKHLRGHEHECRLRVGMWRVRFTSDAERTTIIVMRVLPRNRAYRGGGAV